MCPHGGWFTRMIDACWRSICPQCMVQIKYRISSKIELKLSGLRLARESGGDTPQRAACHVFESLPLLQSYDPYKDHIPDSQIRPPLQPLGNTPKFPFWNCPPFGGVARGLIGGLSHA